METVHSKTKSKLLMIIYLFLLVFNPPLFKNSSFTIVLALFAGGYLLVNWRRTKLVARKCMVNKFAPIFIFSAFYILMVVLINSLFNSDIHFLSYLSTFVKYVFYYMVLIAVVLFINSVSEKKHFTVSDLVICFIWAGALQAFITILTYLFPTVREFTIQLISNNSNSEKISRIIHNTKYFRNYGLASSLYDTFGYSTAILVSLSFVYGLYKKIFYRYLAFVLIAMPFFNSRVGLLLAIVGIVVAIIFFSKPKGIRDVVNKFFTVGIIIIGIIIFYYTLKSRILMNGSLSSEWITSGINDTILFFSGQSSSGYYATLVNNFFFFPTLLKTIIGAGATPMVLIEKNTDVGYVLNIWSYGAIGSIIIYYMNYKIFKTAYKCSKNQMNKTIVFILAIMFFIFMVKLNSLGYGQASVITFPLLFKIIHDQNINEEI